jgi:hypothetical protein
VKKVQDAVLRALTEDALAGVRPGMSLSQALAVLPAKPVPKTPGSTNAAVSYEQRVEPEAPGPLRGWSRVILTVSHDRIVYVEVWRHLLELEARESLSRAIQAELRARFGGRLASKPKHPTWLGPGFQIFTNKVDYAGPPQSWAVFVRMSSDAVHEQVRGEVRTKSVRPTRRKGPLPV